VLPRIHPDGVLSPESKLPFIEVPDVKLREIPCYQDKPVSVSILGFVCYLQVL
jgi:hypothetical protein